MREASRIGKASRRRQTTGRRGRHCQDFIRGVAHVAFPVTQRDSSAPVRAIQRQSIAIDRETDPTRFKTQLQPITSRCRSPQFAVITAGGRHTSALTAEILAGIEPRIARDRGLGYTAYVIAESRPDGPLVCVDWPGRMPPGDDPRTGRGSGIFDYDRARAGVAQLAERQPSKLNVAGSNPVSRSSARRHGHRGRERGTAR
jgi:hypothetical protein